MGNYLLIHVYCRLVLYIPKYDRLKTKSPKIPELKTNLATWIIKGPDHNMNVNENITTY